MNIQYSNVVVALIVAVAVFNYAKAFLGSRNGLVLSASLTKSHSVKPVKKVKPAKKVEKTAQVSFNTPQKSLRTASEIKAKEEFDKIMAIPAYARKEMNINYPAYL